MKSPIEAVECLPELLSAIDAQRAAIAVECDRIAAQWAGLGKLCAQRDDHAAEFLGNLSAPLARLESFARNVQTQIARFKADPFGRKVA